MRVNFFCCRIFNLIDECDILKRRVDEWGLGFEVGKIPSLIEGSADCSAFELYQKMWCEGISALPIVDKSGKCVATLSPSDLRRLDMDNIKR
jgi:CBS domain-containing protein